MRGPTPTRRLRALRRHIATEPSRAPTREPAASAAQPVEAPREEPSAGLLSDADMAAFVQDGFVVLENLVDAGDISQQTCDDIFGASTAERVCSAR